MTPKHAIYKNKILWKFNMKISYIIYENELAKFYNIIVVHMYHFRYEINLEIETILPEWILNVIWVRGEWMHFSISCRQIATFIV